MNKRCLLIVDDEDDITIPILRKAILDYSDRYEPITAVDGYDALETMKKRDVAVVILDIRMRNLDGWGVIAKAQEDAVMRRIPIVVSSGHLDDEDKNRLQLLGIKYILDKPYPMETLFKAVLEADQTGA
jgi:CheY-like chemotaxis protein